VDQFIIHELLLEMKEWVSAMVKLSFSFITFSIAPFSIAPSRVHVILRNISENDHHLSINLILIINNFKSMLKFISRYNIKCWIHKNIEKRIYGYKYWIIRIVITCSGVKTYGSPI
ncbi:hypothetical protein ACJX0J_040505, partial [Zea mays]